MALAGGGAGGGDGGGGGEVGAKYYSCLWSGVVSHDRVLVEIGCAVVYVALLLLLVLLLLCT